jgi:hypothetical protein
MTLAVYRVQRDSPAGSLPEPRPNIAHMNFPTAAREVSARANRRTRDFAARLKSKRRTTMKCKRHLVLMAAFALPALANADDWVTTQGISYMCGGVGDASQAQMKSEEGSADAQIVTTAGGDGAYLSDVQLSVASADKQHTATWQATGPICLLKLPQGKSTVDASYGDEHRSVQIAKPTKPGATKQTILNFKTD